MKTFKNLELGLSVTAADVAEFRAALKSHGIDSGKKPVEELFDGKRDEVKGFYLVEEAAEEKPAEVAPVAPTAGAGDEKPGFDAGSVDAAVAEALANGVPVTTEKPLTPEPEGKPVVVRAKAVIKAHAPKGKIKPVRKGTKIANGLELLLAGTSQEVLAGAGIGDDVVDFVNRRVTKRGYGVALTETGLQLVLPEGVAAIAYSGA